MRAFVVLAMAVVAVAANAQILNANAAPNNGSGGIFMDLTPTSQALTVTRFDTFFGSTAAATFSVQVYIRPGSYVGTQTGNAGWTLHDTVSGNSVNNSTLAAITLNNVISLSAGQTTGIYLHGIGGNGLRYFGTGTTSNTGFSNADLVGFSAHSRTGTAAFGGTIFTPRAFAGNIHYAPVPEPATMAALGLGVVAMIRRRRKA